MRSGFPLSTRLLVAALAVAVVARGDGPPDERPADGPLPAGGLVRLTHDGCFKQRPAWSPDGSRLLFARHDEEAIRLYVLDVAGGEQRRLTDATEHQYDAVWSPDGSRIALSHAWASGTQGNVDVFLADGEGGGAAAFDVGVGELSHEEWPAWSPDGRALAFTSTAPGNAEVMSRAIDGGAATRLTNHVGLDAHPCWSPDGARIALATDRWGGLEIAVIRIDGGADGGAGGARRLTESPGLDDYPAWSPDGAHLAFVSNRDGQFEVYLMPAEGGAAVNVSRSPAVDTFPTWTPDGAGLTFVSDRDGQFDVYTLDVGAALAAGP